MTLSQAKQEKHIPDINAFVDPHEIPGLERDVAGVLVYRDRVVMVQSAKGPLGWTWILPQGELPKARLRLGFKDAMYLVLGVPYRVHHNSVALLEGSNPLPPDRPYKEKRITFVGAYLDDPGAIKLPNRHFTRFELVANGHQLWNLMKQAATNRPVKFQLTCAAINRAHELGLLSWSCHDVLAEWERANHAA